MRFAAALKLALPSAAAGVAAALMISATVAGAFEVPADEKDRLKACEKDLCEIILKKDQGADLACSLSKTWAKDKIKDGVSAKSIDWSLGDARCGVELSVQRDVLLKALSEPSYELTIPEHQVKCEIEGDDGITTVSMTLAPKLTFENGQATKASLGIGNVEAPAVLKGAIWSVAKVEEYFGLFQGQLVEEINEFVQKKCAKRYGEGAEQQ
ncbi:MAG: hypothetical protein R3D33_10610 [Hyphomicrobiaceae bacterium]